MSTTVAKAAQKAKIALPLNKRVWMWVKDHPGVTAVQIARGINAPAGGVSSVLSQMVIRKMVERVGVPATGPGTTNGKTWTYTVPARMKEYELHSAPKKKPKAPMEPVAEVPEVAPKPKSGKDFLKELSIEQGYELYTELKAMFGRG